MWATILVRALPPRAFAVLHRRRQRFHALRWKVRAVETLAGQSCRQVCSRYDVKPYLF